MIYLKLSLMALFWGGAFVAGRSVSLVMGPFSASFLRFLMASIILGCIILFKPSKSRLYLNWKMTGGLLLLGLTGIAIYNVFFFSGLRTVYAGRASAIITTNPILVMILSLIFYHEKISFSKITGIFLSVCGACVVIFKGQIQLLLQGSVGIGELYILGCVVSWAIYSIMGKRILKTVSPLHAVFMATVFGVLFLFFPAIQEGLFQHLSHIQWLTWIDLLYLALGATVLGFVWFYDGVQEIGPTKASQFVNFVPISAMILSALFLHEPLTLSLLIGTFLVIIGVTITQYSQ
ncbi:DMT family transporter [bacterium]